MPITARWNSWPRSKLAGRADRLHELSLFERVDGRWLYLRALDQSARS